jgi:hypothetical protein
MSDFSLNIEIEENLGAEDLRCYDVLTKSWQTPSRDIQTVNYYLHLNMAGRGILLSDSPDSSLEALIFLCGETEKFYGTRILEEDFAHDCC